MKARNEGSPGLSRSCFKGGHSLNQGFWTSCTPPQTTTNHFLFPFYFFFLVIFPSGDGTPNLCLSPRVCWIQKPRGNNGTKPPLPGSVLVAVSSHLGHHTLFGPRNGAGLFQGHLLDLGRVVRQTGTVLAHPQHRSLAPLHCFYGSKPLGREAEGSQYTHRPLGPALIGCLF